MWTIRYEDGTSLTTAREQTARRLADAERQQGRDATVVRGETSDATLRAAEQQAGDEPSAGDEPFAGDEPSPGDEPSAGLEPSAEAEPIAGADAQQVEPPAVVAPADAPRPGAEAERPVPWSGAEAERPLPRPGAAGRRRALGYVVAAAAIVAAAVVAIYSGWLPTVGGTTRSGAVPASPGADHSYLLPPLQQPPVMHFGETDGAATPTPTALVSPSAQQQSVPAPSVQPVPPPVESVTPAAAQAGSFEQPAQPSVPAQSLAAVVISQRPPTIVAKGPRP